MKKLRMFNAMNELESEIQSLCGIRTSVSRTCLKLTNNPNTLFENIDKYMKNVFEDRAPHLWEEERKKINNTIKHYTPILAGLATLTSQMQKLVSFYHMNKETVAADH